MKILVTFLLLCASSLAWELQCNYVFNNVDSVYTCEVANSQGDSGIVSVRGDHIGGKTNDDVKSIWASDGHLKYFPKGLTKFFPNIESVNIWGAEEIRTITKDDLKEFGDKLKTLLLADMEIEAIEADLFENNPNLERFGAYKCDIKNIDVKAFEKLEKLRAINLIGNSNCTSDDAYVQSDRRRVLKLLEKLGEDMENGSCI